MSILVVVTTFEWYRCQGPKHVLPCEVATNTNLLTYFFPIRTYFFINKGVTLRIFDACLRLKVASFTSKR